MVLEEILIIRGPIDAPEVVRAFSEAGMPARITQTVALEGLVSAKGKIRDIKALLKEENARIEELAEEFRTEEGIEETGIEEDEEETGAGRLHDNPGLNVVERIEVIEDANPRRYSRRRFKEDFAARRSRSGRGTGGGRAAGCREFRAVQVPGVHLWKRTSDRDREDEEWSCLGIWT